MKRKDDSKQMGKKNFGFQDFKEFLAGKNCSGLTYNEIADGLGITPQKVRQLRKELAMSECSNSEYNDVFFRLLKSAEIGKRADYVVLNIRKESQRMYLNNVLRNKCPNDSKIDIHKQKAEIYISDFAYLMEFMYGHDKIQDFVSKVQNKCPEVIRLAQSFDGNNSNQKIFEIILRALLIFVNFAKFILPALNCFGLDIDSLNEIIDRLSDIDFEFLIKAILHILKKCNDNDNKDKE